MTIDSAHYLLHLLGWSVGEAAFRRPDGSRFWQVDCSRDDHTILATAPTQHNAWMLALKTAGVVERG
jgi:hypothetical protein